MSPRLSGTVLNTGLVCAALVLLCGCATPEFRKTPYYHTKPDTSPAAVKERVPLWPLVFYQSPTLEVMWPFFEKSDEFIAFRPLASVSGLDRPKQAYSLLWPLGQFDREEEQSRFFPLFWGKNYTVAFPLYWHFGHPLGPDGGTDTLLPLWWYSADRQGYSFNALWPVFNIKDRGGELGWRLWPLIGSYSKSDDEYYRFAAWPLAHQWGSRSRGESGEAVLPLYLRASSPSESTFVSLPYSRHRSPGRDWDLALPLFYRRNDTSGSMFLSLPYSQGESKDERDAWQLLFPLYYRHRQNEESTLVTLLGGMRRDAEGSGWIVAPLVSGGSRTKDSSSTWLLGPLAHFGQTPEAKSRHVFPFFYSGEDSSGSLFLSLPWSSRSRADGSEWQLVPPVVLRTADGKDRRIFTPLYSEGTSRGGADWWQTVVPLWYRSESADGRMLATLLGGWETAADGRYWLIWPLLSGGRRSNDAMDTWIVAPLFHARRDSSGVSSHLLPLYWWDAADKTLLSPFVSSWGDPALDGKTTLVPPALTLYSAGPERKDLWTAAGIAHFSWGEKAGSSHVLPLYYWDKSQDTFLSIPWSTWTWNRTSTNTLIAPALSWMTRKADRADLWTVGPLAHFSWGEKAGSSHVFPLFYRYKPDNTFISLLYSHWQKYDGEECDLYPPLLSLYTRDRHRKRLDMLAGLMSETWGDEGREGYFIPFYYHEKDTKFYSLLCGWNRDADNGFFYPLTPLLGVRTGKHSGGWLFPLWSRDRDSSTGRTTGTFLWGTYTADGQHTESSLLPIYGYRNRGAEPERLPAGSDWATYGKTFWSLPAIWYRNTVDVQPGRDSQGKPTGRVDRSSLFEHGLFPLWSYSQQKMPQGGSETDGSLLLYLYNYQRTSGDGPSAAAPLDEKVERRILWRFYYYERHNGNVTMDLFPAITYDSAADGFRRWSFLWRAFRYERGPEGRKLDLLFLPLVRSAPEK